MKEALFFALLAFAGYGLFARIFGRFATGYGVAVAIPLGVLQWGLVSTAMLLAGRTFELVFVLYALLCAYYAVAAWRRHGMAGLLPGLLAASVAMLVSSLSLRYSWFQLSYDSVEQIAIGRALAIVGLSSDLGPALASWGVLLPLLQGASSYLAVDLLTAAQPLFCLSLLGVFLATGWHLAGRTGIFFALLSASLLATSYFFVFQSSYIHNSLMSATFLLLFMGAVTLSGQETQSRWLDLAFLGLIGFTMARTETPLFSALAIVLVAPLFECGARWSRFQALTLCYAAMSTAWCIVMIVLIGRGSDIMTPDRIAILIAATLGATALATWPRGPLVTRVRGWMPVLVIASSLLALGLGYLWKPEHFLHNVNAIENNLFHSGRWGMAWWSVVLVLPVLVALGSDRFSRLFAAFVVGFVSLVFVLGLVRIPYRIGWGDSANRIFTHLLPVIALWLMYALTRKKPASEGGRTDALNQLSPRRAFLVGCCIALPIVIPLLLFFIPPIIPASDVIVRQAEGFCPADAHGRYDFAVALSPDTPESYAAACASGHRSIVLELVNGVRVGALDLQEFAVSEAWTDFSIRISPDGDHWMTVFDATADDSANSRFRIGPTLWRIRLPKVGAVRFVAIDYRASSGQNRLLLRRLTLLK